MALKDAAADLAAHLVGVASGSVTLALGTNLFSGRMADQAHTPSPAVWCLNSGGPSPTPYLASNRQAYYRPTVQVLIRGTAGDEAATFALAAAVFEQCQQAAVTSYVSATCLQAGPMNLGPDADQHDIYVFNVSLHYETALD